MAVAVRWCRASGEVRSVPVSAIKLVVISVMGLFPPDLMDGKTARGWLGVGRAGLGRVTTFYYDGFSSPVWPANWASSNYIIHTTHHR